MIREKNRNRERRGVKAVMAALLSRGPAFPAVLALVLALCLAVPGAALTARAEDYTGKERLEVVYDGSKLTPN